MQRFFYWLTEYFSAWVCLDGVHHIVDKADKRDETNVCLICKYLCHVSGYGIVVHMAIHSYVTITTLHTIRESLERDCVMASATLLGLTK